MQSGHPDLRLAREPTLSCLFSPIFMVAESYTYSGPPMKQIMPPPSSKGLVILRVKSIWLPCALMGSRKARTSRSPRFSSLSAMFSVLSYILGGMRSTSLLIFGLPAFYQ